MSELAIELRAIGRAINHEEYIDAGVVPLTLAHAADRIEALEAALRQEPIAWRERDGDEWHYYDCDYVEAKRLDKDMLEPLYALAPEQDK